MRVCGALSSSINAVRSVKFEVGKQAHDTPNEGRAGFWNDWVDAWVGGNPTKFERIEEVANLLEVVSKQIARCAPRANIGMFEDDRIVLGGTLCELDRMSIPPMKTKSEEERRLLVAESFFSDCKEEEEWVALSEEYFLPERKSMEKLGYGGGHCREARQAGSSRI